MELPPRFSSAGRQTGTHAGSDTQLVDEHVNNGGTVGHMGLRKQLIKDCRLFKNYNNPDHEFFFPDGVCSSGFLRFIHPAANPVALTPVGKGSV